MLKIQTVILLLGCLLFVAASVCAEDIIYTDHEIIRNFGFENSIDDAWHCYPSKTGYSSSAEKDGVFGFELNASDDRDDRYAFQKLILPTELSNLVVHIDYRAVEDFYRPEDAFPVRFFVFLATSKGFDSLYLDEDFPLTPLVLLHEETITEAFDWREISGNLLPEGIAAMQAAHEAGDFVFLVLAQEKINAEEDNGFIVHVDNVSLKVNGVQRVPRLPGRIAYVEFVEWNDPKAVNIIDPNTQSMQRVWTHPGKSNVSWHDVIWSPDGSELAFVSDHEHLASPLSADVYGIRPDGSGLRRITGPTLGEIDDPILPRVTVRGTIRNSAAGAGATQDHIIMGIEGTVNGESLSVYRGETVPFSIANVPILDDPGSFEQVVTLQFSSSECGRGVEHHFPIRPVVNGEVDLGELQFLAFPCFGGFTELMPDTLTWKHDGSEIAFDMNLFFKVPSTFSRAFAWQKVEPGGSGFLTNTMQWSPVDNRYTYIAPNFAMERKELYIAEEGQEPEMLLERDIKNRTRLAWLPDGSGFVYVGNSGGIHNTYDFNLYEYDFASRSSKRLTYFKDEEIDNLSISGDGSHIVFEWHTYDEYVDILNHSPLKSDLWIMNRHNPVEMWRLTSSSNCTGPDWSRTIPQTIPGDVNNDGVVDLKDVIVSLQVAAGQRGVGNASGDITGDGVIGMDDVLSILRATD